MKLEVSDGTLALTVASGETKKELSLDFISTQLLITELEEIHNVPTKDGFVQPTREFLQDLARRLQDDGIEGCTPTMAWQLWQKIYQMQAALKKNIDTPLESPSTTG